MKNSKKFFELKVLRSLTCEFETLAPKESRCYPFEAPDFCLASRDKIIGIEIVRFNNGYDMLTSVETFYRKLAGLLKEELERKEIALDITLAPVSLGPELGQVLDAESSKVSRKMLYKDLTLALLSYILDKRKEGLYEGRDLSDKLDKWFSWICVGQKPRKWILEEPKVELAGMPSDRFSAEALQRIVCDKQDKVSSYLNHVKERFGKPCDELWLLIACSNTSFLSRRHDNSIPLCNSVLPGTSPVMFDGVQLFSRIFLGIPSWGYTLRWHEIGQYNEHTSQ